MGKVRKVQSATGEGHRRGKDVQGKTTVRISRPFSREVPGKWPPFPRQSGLAKSIAPPMLRPPARTRRPAAGSPTGPRPLASLGVGGGGHGAVSGARPALNLQRGLISLKFSYFPLSINRLFT